MIDIHEEFEKWYQASFVTPNNNDFKRCASGGYFNKTIDDVFIGFEAGYMFKFSYMNPEQQQQPTEPQ